MLNFTNKLQEDIESEREKITTAASEKAGPIAPIESAATGAMEDPNNTIEAAYIAMEATVLVTDTRIEQ